MPHICSQKQIHKMETYSNIAKSKADKQVFVASGRNPSRTRSKSATKSVSLQQMQPYFSDKLMSCARKSHFLPFIFRDCYSRRTEGFQSSEVSAFVSRGIRSVKRSSGSNLTASRPDFLGSWGAVVGHLLWAHTASLNSACVSSTALSLEPGLPCSSSGCALSISQGGQRWGQPLGEGEQEPLSSGLLQGSHTDCSCSAAIPGHLPPCPGGSRSSIPRL